MSNLQKIIVLVIGISSVIGLPLAFDSHYAKSNEIQEIRLTVSGTLKYVERLNLQSDVKFTQYQLDRLEDDYRNKPKDNFYIDKKRTLERQILDSEKQLEQINRGK